MRRSLVSIISGALLAASALAADIPINPSRETGSDSMRTVNKLTFKEPHIVAYALGDELKRLPDFYRLNGSELERTSPTISIVPTGNIQYPTNASSKVNWVIDYNFRSDRLPEIRNISFTTNTIDSAVESAHTDAIEVIIAPINCKADGKGNYYITSYGSDSSKLNTSKSTLGGSATGSYSQTPTKHMVTTADKIPTGKSDTISTNREQFTGVLFMYYLEQIPRMKK